VGRLAMRIPDYVIAPYICLLTGDRVDMMNYHYICIQTNIGRKIFQVWLSFSYDQLMPSARAEMVRDVLGDYIDVRNLEY